MLNVAVVTLGCDKNTVDSEKMKGYLLQSGYELVSSVEDADFVVINTCGFIQDAKEESLNTILEYVKVKEKRGLKIIVTGCLAQRYSEVLAKEIPEVDAVLGINYTEELPELLREISSGKKILKSERKNENENDKLAKRVLETPAHYAYLKIAEGCDNCCSYCSIPLIKGRYRSRKMEDILQEAQYLVDNGVKELILIAQDVTYYGIDLYGELKLPKLLKELSKISSLKWIRLLYCYPANITDELINVIATESKICNYIDIPLQHASLDILKKMGRKQNPLEIKELIKNIRSRIPEITLRTTFIIGFPGETDKHFQELLAFIDDVKFDWAGFFRYSREEGTPAAMMKPLVSDEIVKERFNTIVSLQRSITKEKNAEQIAKVLPVVIEGKSDEFPDMYEARSYRNTPNVDGLIYVKGKNLAKGCWVHCKITGVQEYDLIGEVK
jgi:ribosomal protein S12 methylthiotransferase